MPVPVVALFALQIASAPAPMLGTVRAMPPARIGELLLAGQAHETVAAVEEVDQAGPAPPGSVEVDLIEGARREGAACMRRRWRATFRHGSGEAAADARFERASPLQEVALPVDGGCTGASFARVNPGISVAAAVEALERLRRVVTRPADVEIICSSPLDPALCADKDATIARLAATPVWAVAEESGAVELRLGRRGQLPITVGLHPARRDRITVAARAPAPF